MLLDHAGLFANLVLFIDMRCTAGTPVSVSALADRAAVIKGAPCGELHAEASCASVTEAEAVPYHAPG